MRTRSSFAGSTEWTKLALDNYLQNSDLGKLSFDVALLCRFAEPSSGLGVIPGPALPVKVHYTSWN